MNILSWNCRGLGLPTTIKELKGLIRKLNPCILFVCETKMLVCRVNSLKHVLGFMPVFA